MNKYQKKTISFHPNNKHQSGYDLEALSAVHPELTAFVNENSYGNLSIDFADPNAVKALNTGLLKKHYGITFWEFPEANLCPPIPGRVDYIHHLNDLLRASGLKKDITVLDIGTGATCIYPLLGQATYGWNFIGSEVDDRSLKVAQTIIDRNGLKDSIELRVQRDKMQIIIGILNASERVSACMCNPPFFKSEKDALVATKRKLRGLGKGTNDVIRNFSGTQSELWYEGGEKAFLHNYLYQSSHYKTNCFWYTTLVSDKDHVKYMQKSLKKLGVTKMKVIPMSQGNKVSRIVAWSFLTEKEQNAWND